MSEPRASGALLPRHGRAGAVVTVDGVGLDEEALFGAAAVVAQRVHGAPAVAVDAGADIRTVVAVLGCLLAGVPLVPVAADSGPTERAHLLRDSGAGLWLGGPVDGQAVEVVPVDPAERADATFSEPAPESVAMIMYTSGTTGLPKGAVLSRAAVAACLDGLADAWSWTADDVLVHGLPLFHVHGLVLGLLGGLRVGSPVVHTRRPTPERYAEAVGRHGGSLVFGVPTVWSRLAADAPSARALAAARLLVSGSAPLPIPTAHTLTELTGHTMVERYGMTETLITLAQRADSAREVGWVGGPIRGVEARLVDDTGGVIAPGSDVPADLQVRGATLFDGYLGRPDALLDGGWFATGDVAVDDLDGQFRIVGRRATDLIKSGGYRIGAGEVEAALLTHPGVAEVAVVGVPDDDLGQRVVAFVVGDAGSPADGQTLIQHVAEQLSVHKRPREIRYVDELPRNRMGKVQKRDLMGG